MLEERGNKFRGTGGEQKYKSLSGAKYKEGVALLVIMVGAEPLDIAGCVK